jgi:superfamily II DNA or RNA helicase
LDYKKALEYEVIANFKLAFLGVSFSELEMNRYNQIDTELKNLMGKLINTYEIPFEPFGMFIKEVQSMSQANSFSKAKVLANKFLKVFSDRKDMVASATQKYEALKSIVPSIKTAERTIVFTQTIEATHRAVNALRRSGVLAQGIDSSMKRTERADILSKFKSGEIECIVAPKILDEGVDVPEADLAIILASSKTRRQFIQRIGRVVRKKKDGRFAKIIFLYVSGTMEDPKVGSDESFISIVEEVAQSKKRFTDKDSDDLIDFLK